MPFQCRFDSEEGVDSRYCLAAADAIGGRVPASAAVVHDRRKYEIPTTFRRNTANYVLLRADCYRFCGWITLQFYTRWR